MNTERMAVVAKGWENSFMKQVAQKNTIFFFTLNVKALRNWKLLTSEMTKISKSTCSPNVVSW